MSTGKQLSALLLLTTALTFPAGAAFAQDASTGAEGVPAEEDPATDAVMAQEAEGIDDKRWPARMLAGIIDGWKNRALTPDKIPASDAGAYNHFGPQIYAAYQTRLKELNCCDFGDLLLHMVTIFQTHDDVLNQYQRWFKYCEQQHWYLQRA